MSETTFLVDNTSPVLIGGLPRSGTTLMKVLIGSHTSIAMAPSDLQWWTRIYPRYQRTTHSRAWRAFLDELFNTPQFRLLNLGEDQFRQRAESLEPNHYSLFGVILTEFAAQAGKPRWGDKTPLLELYADEILAQFPQARIVHMLRDPRDMCASISLWNQHTKFHRWMMHGVAWMAMNWRQSAQLAVRHQAHYPDRYLLVRYEELVADPVAKLGQICQFLGETFHADMLDMAEFTWFREQGGNSSFGRLEGISRSPVGRFRHTLAPAKIRLCEWIAGAQLTRQGYQRSGVKLRLTDWLRLIVIEMPIATLHILLRKGVFWARALFPRLTERRPLALLDKRVMALLQNESLDDAS